MKHAIIPTLALSVLLAALAWLSYGALPEQSLKVPSEAAFIRR